LLFGKRRKGRHKVGPYDGKSRSIAPAFCFGCTKGNPRLCRGNKRALAENKEIKKNPSVEQKWFADHTATIERDSN